MDMFWYSFVVIVAAVALIQRTVVNVYILLFPPAVSIGEMSKLNKMKKGLYKLGPGIFCQRPLLVQRLLKDEQNTIKPLMYPMMGKFIGEGLLTMETGEKWKSHRKLLTWCFKNEVIQQLVNPTLCFTQTFISRSSKCNQPIELFEPMKLLSFYTSLHTITGIDANKLEEDDIISYLDAVEYMSGVTMKKIFSPLYRLLSDFTWIGNKEQECVQIIKNFTIKILEMRKDLLKIELEDCSEVNHRRSIIQSLIEEDLFVDDVIDELNTFIFAGFGTLATLVTFMLFILGNHPDIQKRILNEINSKCPNLTKGDLDLKEINQLELLESCIKECLRLYPPAPVIGRKLLTPLKTSCGNLPSGTDIYVNIFDYHRNEKIFPNAEVFDPERFLLSKPDETTGPKFIPFGLGPRTCIAQWMVKVQAKIIIAAIVKAFSIRSIEEIESLKLEIKLILRSENGFKVAFDKRKEQLN